MGLGIACNGWAQGGGTSGTTALRLLPAMRVRYRVRSSSFPYRLSAELLWQTDGRRYEAQQQVSALGLRRAQRSMGRIGAQGLEPLRYVDGMRGEDEVARFEREQGRIAFEATRTETALQAGAQDRLSLLPHLATLWASDATRFSPGAQLKCQVAGPRAADVWALTVTPAEILSLPGGEQRCVRLLRPPDATNDQKLEIWLAGALGYLPVRVQLTEANGDVVDQQWESHETVVGWSGQLAGS